MIDYIIFMNKMMFDFTKLYTEICIFNINFILDMMGTKQSEEKVNPEIQQAIDNIRKKLYNSFNDLSDKEKKDLRYGLYELRIKNGI